MNTYTLTYEDCLPYLELVLSYLDRSGGDDACHTYTGGHVVSNGYGRVTLKIQGKQRHVRVHRFMYVIHNKEDINTKDVIDHYVCHNPSCGNPRHLRKTTFAGNMRTMVDAGRGRHGKALLTSEQVVGFRKRYAAGESLSSILKDSPLTYTPTRNAILGVTYKHLPMFSRPEGFVPVFKVLTPEDVAIIKARFLLGHRFSEVQADYPSVSRSALYAIKSGGNWSYIEPAPLHKVRAMYETASAAD